MSEDFLIDEQATLRSKSIEEVYDSCLSWLKIKKAKIVEERRPNFVKALHGRGEGIWAQDTGKFFIIELVQKYDCTVIVKFQIPPLKWLLKRKKPYIYHFWWYQYIEELWTHLGVTINETYLKRLYPYTNLKKMKKRNFLVFYFITIVCGISIVVFLLSAPFMIVPPVGLWFLAAYPRLLEANKLNKKMLNLYPD